MIHRRRQYAASGARECYARATDPFSRSPTWSRACNMPKMAYLVAADSVAGVLALWLLLTVLDAAPLEVLLIAYCLSQRERRCRFGAAGGSRAIRHACNLQ